MLSLGGEGRGKGGGEEDVKPSEGGTADQGDVGGSDENDAAEGDEM